MGVPNQNDINKIVKSQVESLNDVINIVIKSSSTKIVKNANKHINNIKAYQSLVNVVFGEDGIGTIMLNVYNSMDKIAMFKPLNFSVLKQSLKRLNKFINFLADFKFNSRKIKKLSNKLDSMKKVVDLLQEIFSTFAKINTPKLFTTKFLMIKISLWRIVKVCMFLSLLNLAAPVMAASLVSLKLLTLVTGMLAKVFADIESIHIGIGTYIKLKLIPGILRRMMRIITAVNVIARYIVAVGGLKDSLILSAVFNMLESVFTSIKNIKVGLFMRIKLNRICRAILLLNKIVKAAARIRIRPKALLAIIIVRLLLVSLAVALTMVVLISPIVILAIPALLILMIGMFTFRFVMNIVIRCLVRLAARKAIKGLAAMLIIGFFLTMLALMFLTLALVAQPIVKASLWIIGMLLLITVVVALVAGIGFLMSFLAPVMLVILLGLVMVVAIIGVIFILALMLKIISMLDLDSERIKTNVGIVLETCMTIIKTIFQPDNTNPEKSNKSWIGSIINFIGGTLKTIVQAIMAVAFLAVMVVAILFVLLIAGQLRLLQELNLLPDKINENVNIVIETATLVIDSIFNRDEVNAKASNKSWLGSLLQYIGSDLAVVIQAIMAVAFLAAIAAAIAMLLLISSQLRILQILDLKPSDISKNVNIVIETATLVIDSIFNRDEANAKPTNKSWIEGVLKKFGGDLYTIVQAIMAIGFLAVMIVAIVFIGIIAKQLETIQVLDIKPELITEKVKTIIETCTMVVDAITKPEEAADKPTKKSWIRKLFEHVGGNMLSIVDAITAMAWLGSTIAIISLVKILAEHLSYISQIKLPKNITPHVEELITCANQVINAVINRPDPMEGLTPDNKRKKFLRWLLPNSLENIIDTLSSMRWVSSVLSNVGVVMQLSEHLVKLKALPDMSGVNNIVNNICNTADEVAKMIIEKTGVDIEESGSRLKFIERLHEAIVGFGEVKSGTIKKAQNAIQGHLDLIEKINKMDITKLETSAKLFEQIAEFSKSIRGDFNGLAEAITEELMPTLDRMEDILKNTTHAFKNMSEDLSDLNNTTQRANINVLSANEHAELAKNEAERQFVLKYGVEYDENNATHRKEMKLEEKNANATVAQLRATTIGAKLDLLTDLFLGQGPGEYPCAQVISMNKEGDPIM